MNVGIYQSAASLAGLERWQDAVAQNISASQVNGFKRRTVQMSGTSAGELVLQNPSPSARASGTSAADTRALLFPQVRYGVAFQPGEAEPTRRELDVALSGEGFLNVRLPDGQTAYTRAGALQLRPDRTLITASGLEVLDEGGQTIQLPATGGELVIDESGLITKGDTPAGRLAVTRFDQLSALTPLPGGVFLASPAAGAQPVTEPALRQGYLEGSNVQPLREMVDLVHIARAYQANQKLIQSRDDLMQRTLESLG